MRATVRRYGISLGALVAFALVGCSEAAETSPLAPGVRSGPSFHQAGPCNASPEPGNSEYAQHHIVPLAKAGAMGDGGHKPGAHRGYSVCNPSEQ